MALLLPVIWYARRPTHSLTSVFRTARLSTRFQTTLFKISITVIVGVGYQVMPACCNQADTSFVNLCHIARLVGYDIFRAAQHKYYRRLCDNRIWFVGSLKDSWRACQAEKSQSVAWCSLVLQGFGMPWERVLSLKIWAPRKKSNTRSVSD